MVEWIDKRAQGDRARVGTLAGMVCIVANVALCAAKGAIGVVSGSVSIVADAMNNLSDASSNIVSVLGFKLASKPADPEHPYGHGRYEYLSGLVVAALVLLIVAIGVTIWLCRNREQRRADGKTNVGWAVFLVIAYPLSVGYLVFFVLLMISTFTGESVTVG